MGGEYEYDVALSFAGENRAIAEQFAKLLKAADVKVFYDDWKTGELWGRDLYQHLDEVYSQKARFCVMFISAAYAAKTWTNHELKSAQERAFLKNETYILPIRLDDTDIAGIRATTGYVDLRKQSIEQVAQLAIEKIIGRTSSTGGKLEKGIANRPDEGPLDSPSPPRGRLRLKKQFTDQDRDDFLEGAFQIVAKHFQDTLTDLAVQSPGFSGKFKLVNSNHFTAVIYRDGKNAAQCGIRLGGFIGGFTNQIVYSSDPNTTNSMNESVSVAEQGDELFLKSSGMASMTGAKQNSSLTPLDAAELFWGILTWPIVHSRST